MLKQIKAVTLLEIVIVVILIGIIAAVGLPGLTSMRERAIDKEARANLKLIQAAERIYLMEETLYFPPDGSTEDDIGDINTELRLSLTEDNWDFAVTGGGTLQATAIRTNPPNNWTRTFRIDQAAGQACCCPTGTAPASVCMSAETCGTCP